MSRLDGSTILVLGEVPAADRVSRGLTALGGRVVRDPAEAADTALVVIPVTDPAGIDPRPLVEMDDSEWDRRCEAPLRTMRVALQAAHTVLQNRGGRVIVLVPTISMIGAAGFVPYSAVGEGARSLAKAAARAWGKLGITVNCLGLTLEQLHPGQGEAPPTESKVPRALGRIPNLESEVADLIAGLAAGPNIVTGMTVMADGGDVMSV